MPKEFLLTLQLKTQGQIKGSSTKKGSGSGVSGGIECHSFEYAIESPRDAASEKEFKGETGSSIGKRTHKPIVIVREVDSASPLLWQALCTNEGFQLATLSFAKPSSSGKETVYQRITLTNGTISNIGYAQPLNGKRRQAITFQYEDLAVNGAVGVHIPLSLLRKG
jgi:type VI secretion system secreted protein Hcp